MKIALIIRSTLYSVPGGDTIQVMQTAKWLRKLGFIADIHPTNARINYDSYDVFHFFNINRPADILFHISRIKVPVFISPVLVDYAEYDKNHRKGFSGFVLQHFSPAANEFIKTISRWLAGKDILQPKSYIWKGQIRSIKEILRRTTALLPNSEAEYRDTSRLFSMNKPYAVIPNGIDADLFVPDEKISKEDKLIVCAARIEGIKNQLNLIKAVNDTDYTLMLIGSPGPNQKKYYAACRRAASKNIRFISHLPQEELLAYYQKAKVHVLPSWFETCGLSSLEAAVMGCNIVVTDKGYTREYFGDDAFYCDPGKPESILNAIKEAAQSECRKNLQQKISQQFTWERAAALTAAAYKKYS